MSSETRRDDFAARQAEMTARWYENVRRQHGDVDAYIARRYAAYLDRWKEAARFLPDGCRVLDIGGGNLNSTIIEFLKQRKFRYSYFDIDPACVESSSRLAVSLGLDVSDFKQGFNDNLAFHSDAFEGIFSSHCIEHSIDLRKTLSELRRVLVDGGNLMMAVPFGWEVNDEHPYFFGPTEWLTLVEDAGFQIRVAQIGKEYPENGYDFFICGQLNQPFQSLRIDPDDYRKERFQFVSFADPSVVITGKSAARDGHVIMAGTDWEITIKPPPGAVEILPIMKRHDWSAIVEMTWGNVRTVEDLYSWFPFVQPIRAKRFKPKTKLPVVVRPIGRNLASRSGEGVLYGYMWR